MSFSYPTGTAGDCLGRTPCMPANKCLKGCNNLRWNDGPNERAIDRRELRKSFGNYIINDSNSPVVGWATGAQLQNRVQLPCANGDFAGPGILTPFRRAMNAGDPYVKVNSPPSSTIFPPPSNQVQGSRRASNQAAASTAGNGRKTIPGGSAYTGNPKRVYDSSDYIRFKKLQAKNRNYNDPTFGGDMHHASQVALSRVRH